MKYTKLIDVLPQDVYTAGTRGALKKLLETYSVVSFRLPQVGEFYLHPSGRVNQYTSLSHPDGIPVFILHSRPLQTIDDIWPQD